MATSEVKRIADEMSLRTALADGLRRLDKTLTELDESDCSLDDAGRVESLLNLRFETDFPSFCYSIATGVGKTRLLGATIAYLYRTRGWTDYFTLVPGSTIYQKFKTSDFVPGGKKDIFAGLTDFPAYNLVTIDNFRQVTQQGLFPAPLNIYLFNIGLIFEGKAQRQFKFSRVDADGLGEEYKEGFAGYLAEKRPVMLMDEAHRYYAKASLNAMNRLKPRLGIEFTATPTYTKNILYSFGLGKAIDAKYVKRPRIARFVNDNTPASERDQLVLREAARNHEKTKGDLAAFCRNRGYDPITPILLVTTEDIDHANRVAAYLEGKTELTQDGELLSLYDGVPFGEGTDLKGRYTGKVLVVHSKTEDDTDKAVKELDGGRYEIVVHVNKLKEGLDVTNIYTLAVLRASKSGVLTEQIIGRGLRLPFGRLLEPGEDDDEIVANLNALDIMPHEEYEKVIAAADADLRDRIDTQDVDVSRKVVEKAARRIETIHPLSDPKLQIEIPKIETELTNTEARLGVFKLAPSHEVMEDGAFERRAEMIDVRTRETTEISVIEGESVADPMGYLVRHALRNLTELDADDVPALKDLARNYLVALRPAESEWPAAVEKRKDQVVRDFVGQLRANIEDLHPVVQKKRDAVFALKEWSKSVADDYVIPPYTTPGTEDKLKFPLVSGYVKSIYPVNSFDSSPEKILADMLERDRAVVRWVRLPKSQLKVGMSGGNYEPDFVAAIQDKTGAEKLYLIEVKAGNKCDPKNPDPDVLKKFQQAKAWAKEANGGIDDAPWRYRLLTDDQIKARKNDDVCFLLDASIKLA